MEDVQIPQYDRGTLVMLGGNIVEVESACWKGSYSCILTFMDDSTFSCSEEADNWLTVVN